MSIYGDYGASIDHGQRARELQAEARRDSMVRRIRAAAKRRREEDSRACTAAGRTRTA